jgi:hypothetical protein
MKQQTIVTAELQRMEGIPTIQAWARDPDVDPAFSWTAWFLLALWSLLSLGAVATTNFISVFHQNQIGLAFLLCLGAYWLIFLSTLDSIFSMLKEDAKAYIKKHILVPFLLYETLLSALTLVIGFVFTCESSSVSRIRSLRLSTYSDQLLAESYFGCVLALDFTVVTLVALPQIYMLRKSRFVVEAASDALSEFWEKNPKACEVVARVAEAPEAMVEGAIGICKRLGTSSAFRLSALDLANADLVHSLTLRAVSFSCWSLHVRAFSQENPPLFSPYNVSCECFSFHRSTA